MPNDTASAAATSQTQTQTAVSTPTQTTDTGSGSQPTTPTGPTRLSDDMEVIYDGLEKPVKFSNIRGLQSQFTKVSQAKAGLEKQFKDIQGRNSQLENTLKAILGQQVSGPKADPYEGIKDLPYVRGSELAQTLNQFQAQRQQEVGQLTQLMQVMAQKLNEQGQIIQTLNRSHTAGSFDKKIRTFLEALKLDPDEHEDDAKYFYLAHEGDDLDEAFPDLYKKHIDSKAAKAAARKEKLREMARNRPFVPGRGGLSAAAKDGVSTAGMSPKEIADKFFPMLQGENT